MINLVLISLAVGLSVYLFLKWATKNHDVFEKQGIKYEKPLPLIGNNLHILTGDFLGAIQRTYSKFSEEKVVGVFNFLKSAYFLRSPDLIKQLIVKDFSYFQDHITILSNKSDDLTKNILFSMKGKQWRDMRSSLNPMFTGRKMRIMLDLITDCSEKLCTYLKEDYEKNGPTAQSMKTLFSKYSNDVIATCAFGVQVNSLKNPNNDIYKICQQMMGGVTGKITFMQMVRKKENIQRPDMLQLLMKLKDGNLHKDKDNDEIDPENKMINGQIRRNWTDNELIAQCFQFFIGGFHTVSTVLSFCSYELAVNPDLQEKLFIEVDETHKRLEGNPLTYEVLTKMKYMDMFISEVLRMWPPLIATDRECKKSYSYEDQDGLKFTIQEGDILYVPIYSLHKYFPNPQKFDPERFSDENKPNINTHAYLPFGVGPRNCIAFRFALMEMRAVIFQLLLNFRLTTCQETQIPLEKHVSIFGLMPKSEIYLQFIPRKEKIT